MIFLLFSAPEESLEALGNFGLMPDTGSHHATTVDATKAKFDDIAVAAYSKNVSDHDLIQMSRIAPKRFSPSEKVRFMEIMAASLEDSQPGLC